MHEVRYRELGEENGKRSKEQKVSLNADVFINSHRVHRFNNISLEKIKIVVISTNGDRSARIYEIRCYEEKMK